MKEAVQLNLHGVTNELPYRNYYRQRNGLVAQNVAAYLGLSYYDEKPIRVKADQLYQVPAVTLVRDSVPNSIGTVEDFYGTLVNHRSQVGKAILHKSVSSNAPGFYSPDFAHRVRDLVLPGFSAFSKADLIRTFKKHESTQTHSFRLKLPEKSDGHGQYQIRDQEHLDQILKTQSDKVVAEEGLVIEADLHDAQTISVGFAVLGNDTYSFIADQRNDVAEGRQRYLGAGVIVIRGDMRRLVDATQSGSNHEKAVRTAQVFYDHYSHFDPVASRLSFDYLTGYDKQREHLSGITDITARLGGTCPALLLSVLELKKNPQATAVKAEVNLNYDPSQSHEFEKDAVLYIDDPTLRLSARVNTVL